MPEAASSADLTPDLSAMSDEEANLEGLDSESCEGEMKSKVESLHVVVRLEGDGGIKIMELLNFTHKKKIKAKVGEATYPWMLEDDLMIKLHQTEVSGIMSFLSVRTIQIKIGEKWRIYRKELEDRIN